LASIDGIEHGTWCGQVKSNMSVGESFTFLAKSTYIRDLATLVSHTLGKPDLPGVAPPLFVLVPARCFLSLRLQGILYMALACDSCSTGMYPCDRKVSSSMLLDTLEVGVAMKNESDKRTQ
jgi:hypothetical protein